MQLKYCKYCKKQILGTNQFYCNQRCMGNGYVNSGAPNYKGGRVMHGEGYVLVYDKTHPNVMSGGYVFEHVKVMAESIGRPLKKNEIVHHKNHVKNDNRIENLELMKRGYHTKSHKNQIRMNGLWYKLCKMCNKTKRLEGRNFHFWGKSFYSFCRPCALLQARNRRKLSKSS